ncbi:DUF397 domain-containing protein [Nocardiopsis gilva YIM 90087]|uniref:DUF397 domain-containing protein n=1 Tax=Nocardiopsis gilva YIM 90087 TaxID=1235441 RepID=A0A223S694_9ACTN|nr:DUF397 domain-containing protein [Nocardiopsis gilva]ASU83636.1 DUF397 domain-containing protein [Nocardiopsis gilva YIM 90087]
MDALNWSKSSYSGGGNPDCVEVARRPAEAHVRDTQNRHLGHLTIPAQEWSAFLSGVRTDRL